MSAIPKPPKGHKGAFRRRETARDKARPYQQGAGYRDTGTCGDLGPQDQECIQRGGHWGWHLADDGTAWLEGQEPVTLAPEASA